MSKNAKFSSSPTYQYLKARDFVRERMGLHLEINPFSGPEFSFHDMYLSKYPRQEEGLIYPSDFTWWKKISREELPEVEFLLEKHVSDGLTEDEHKMVDTLMPIFNIDLPPKTVNRLLTIVKRQLRLDPENQTSRGICIIPEEEDRYYEEYITSPEKPKAFLPPKSWFKGALQDIDETDILTILPNAESNVYVLTIGRALVGPSGVTHVRTNRKIEHSWRTAPVMTGMPGIGKSTITLTLGEALNTVGYKVSGFNTLGKQFGLSDIICSDLAYADDLNSKTFKDYIESPIIKQAITGGSIRTEKKFLDEVESVPTAAFLCNINDFDINVTYGTDDGVLDRLKILNCNMPTQFDLNKRFLKGISRNSPDLHPVPHLEWLCSQLGCSMNALMLRFARICADRFLEELDRNTLTKTMNNYTCELEVQLHKHFDKVLAMVFQLSYILRRKKAYTDELPDLKPQLLGSAVKAAQFLVIDDRAFWAREVIKQDWCEKRRPSYHPWTGFKLIELISLDNAVKDYEANAHVMADKAIDQCIQTIYKALRLNQGYNVPANISQVTRAWDGSKRQFNSLLEIANKVRNNVHVSVLEALQSGENADTDHIREEGYNRQLRADKLRTMHTDKRASKLEEPQQTLRSKKRIKK